MNYEIRIFFSLGVCAVYIILSSILIFDWSAHLLASWLILYGIVSLNILMVYTILIWPFVEPFNLMSLSLLQLFFSCC
jgi:hypothetical protein